jgi:hypothetical protein
MDGYFVLLINFPPAALFYYDNIMENSLCTHGEFIIFIWAVLGKNECSRLDIMAASGTGRHDNTLVQLQTTCHVAELIIIQSENSLALSYIRRVRELANSTGKDFGGRFRSYNPALRYPDIKGCRTLYKLRHEWNTVKPHIIMH